MTAWLLCAMIAAPGAPRIEVRVDGEGVLRFAREGRVVYAKRAVLTAADGRLVHADGAALLPTIPAPSGVTALRVGLDGTVRADAAGREAILGRLVLAVFADERRLMPIDGGLLVADVERPQLAEPGEGLAGVVRTVGPPAPAATTAPQPAPQPDPRPGVPNRPAATTTGTPSRVALVEPADRPLPTPARGSVQVTVHLLTELDASQFRLGDIAEIMAPEPLRTRLASLVIGPVPPIGVPRPVDAAYLRSRLLGAGLETRDLDLAVPAGAKVQRPFQTVGADQLVPAAVAAARDRFGAAGEWRPAGPRIDPLRVPPGDVEVRATDAAGDALRARVVVHVFVGGVRAASSTLELAREGVLPAPRPGTEVKVRVRAGGAAIETTGKVVRAGGPGEPVEVAMPNGERLSGHLVALGIVEVKL